MDERNEDNFEVEADHAEGADHVEVNNTDVHMGEPNGSGNNPVAVITIVVLLALLAYGLYIFMNRDTAEVIPPTVPVEETEDTEEEGEVVEPADETTEGTEVDVDADVDLGGEDTPTEDTEEPVE